MLGEYDFRQADKIMKESGLRAARTDIERRHMDWSDIKKIGSSHYKAGDVEPIDLYRSGGMLKDFALCSIIKYAYRQKDGLRESDLDKIIHYAEMLKAITGK